MKNGGGMENGGRIENVEKWKTSLFGWWEK